MRARLLVAALLAAACGGGGADRPQPPADSLEEEAAAAAPDTVLPDMPAIPERRGGWMTGTAAGALEFEDAWQARAGRCVRPAMLLVLAEDPGRSGGSVLLELPVAGDPVVTYPVRVADSAGVPTPPAAQLGFQFFEGQRADAYQAADGEVRVYALDERHVSGEFQVTVRHITTEARARIAGVFHNVDVEPLPPDWCERAQSAQDSLAVGAR